MICINCSQKTSVTNSRPHKKTAQIWRRRQCAACSHSFTTYERVALHEVLLVQRNACKPAPFNSGILFTDIYKCFQHKPEKAAEYAFWIARDIEDKVVMLQQPIIPSEELKQHVYSTLQLFDPLAAVQFAAKHGLVTTLRKIKTRRAPDGRRSAIF